MSESKPADPLHESSSSASISSASWASDSLLSFMFLQVHEMNKCKYRMESYYGRSYMTSAGTQSLGTAGICDLLAQHLCLTFVFDLI